MSVSKNPVSLLGNSVKKDVVKEISTCLLLRDGYFTEIKEVLILRVQ